MSTAMTTRPHAELTADPDLHSTAKQFGSDIRPPPTLGQWRHPGRFALLRLLLGVSRIHRSDGRSPAASVCGLGRTPPEPSGPLTGQPVRPTDMYPIR